MQKSEGSFYVRESASKPGAFTVDVRTESAVEPLTAWHVYRSDDGFFRFSFGDFDIVLDQYLYDPACAV